MAAPWQRATVRMQFSRPEYFGFLRENWRRSLAAISANRSRSDRKKGSYERPGSLAGTIVGLPNWQRGQAVRSPPVLMRRHKPKMLNYDRTHSLMSPPLGFATVLTFCVRWVKREFTVCISCECTI